MRHYPGCAVFGCEATDCELSPLAVRARRQRVAERQERELRERPWRGVTFDIGKEEKAMNKREEINRFVRWGFLDEETAKLLRRGASVGEWRRWFKARVEKKKERR